jgi:hypothetical protein
MQTLHFLSFWKYSELSLRMLDLLVLSKAINSLGLCLCVRSRKNFSHALYRWESHVQSPKHCGWRTCEWGVGCYHQEYDMWMETALNSTKDHQGKQELTSWRKREFKVHEP